MKKHSTKNPNRVYQFTLTQQGEKILESFATKYGTTKSVIIDKALSLLAAQYHRKIVIQYELLTEDEITTTTTTDNEEYRPKPTKKQPSAKTDEDEVSDDEMIKILMDLGLSKQEATLKVLKPCK